MFFFFKQKTAYEISACLVGSEMCIRDRYMGNRKIMRKVTLLSFVLCAVIGLALTSHLAPTEGLQSSVSLPQLQSGSKMKTRFFGAIFKLVFKVAKVIIKAVAKNGKRIIRHVPRRSNLGRNLFRRFGSNRQVKFYKGGVVRILRKGVVKQVKARGGLKKLLKKVGRVVKKQEKKILRKSKRSKGRRSRRNRPNRNRRNRNRRNRNRRNRNRRRNNRRRNNRRRRNRRNRRCRRSIGRANNRVRNLRRRLSRLRRQIDKIKELIREAEQIAQTRSEETRQETVHETTHTTTHEDQQ
eukprot:TRINITY_DN567_c0_g1_i3.p1 TRINITY_DN567_c0_g1~~TRINITY_DN567_c0_g1_i3.p1  ORF type:complete len:296 (+),score=77.57 TRINITY_DN567_c0_g1_i3:42-929(+)